MRTKISRGFGLFVFLVLAGCGGDASAPRPRTARQALDGARAPDGATRSAEAAAASRDGPAGGPERSGGGRQGALSLEGDGTEGCARSRDPVSDLVRSRLFAISICYQRLAMYDSYLARRRGRIAVSIEPRPDGSLRAVRITEDTLGDPMVAECVLDNLRGRRVDPHEGAPEARRFSLRFSP